MYENCWKNSHCFHINDCILTYLITNQLKRHKKQICIKYKEKEANRTLNRVVDVSGLGRIWLVTEIGRHVAMLYVYFCNCVRDCNEDFIRNSFNVALVWIGLPDGYLAEVMAERSCCEAVFIPEESLKCWC